MSAQGATLKSKEELIEKWSKPDVISGSEMLLRSLLLEGVDCVFGYPGGAVLFIYDAMYGFSDFNHLLTRHEQGAIHAADGYARSTGKVGVCIATSGPGATNLVTGIATAYMDSVPLVVITGNVATHLIGTDAFQEADIVGITMPVTKHSYLVRNVNDLPRIIHEAFHIANTGRKGPVLIDIPKDVSAQKALFQPAAKVDLRGYNPTVMPNRNQVDKMLRAIEEAERPLLLVGGGAVYSGAHEELFEFVAKTEIPITTTLLGLGAFPSGHALHLGLPGMHGTWTANNAIQNADLLISIGARFDDRVTGKAALFAPNAKVVHVDIDPAEISKIRTADVPIVGDLRDVLVDLDAAFLGVTGGQKPDIDEWWAFLDGLRDEFPLGYAQPTDGLLSPQYVISRIGELTGPEGVYAAGVGQHQMWAAQFIKYERPNAWLNSGGAGTMGYSVPAAMGAKVAEPDRVVWAIDGDGCFQMTNQELATCVINNIPIKVAIINNSSLGMVRQWQTLFYDGRYSNTDLNTGHDTIRIPDFVKLAEAYGCLALRVEKEEDVDAAIRTALETNDRPVVIDFVVSADAMVWPMVPQGVSNSYVQYARDHAPTFDEEA